MVRERFLAAPLLLSVLVISTPANARSPSEGSSGVGGCASSPGAAKRDGVFLVREEARLRAMRWSAQELVPELRRTGRHQAAADLQRAVLAPTEELGIPLAYAAALPAPMTAARLRQVGERLDGIAVLAVAREHGNRFPALGRLADLTNEAKEVWANGPTDRYFTTQPVGWAEVSVQHRAGAMERPGRKVLSPATEARIAALRETSPGEPGAIRVQEAKYRCAIASGQMFLESTTSRRFSQTYLSKVSQRFDGAYRPREGTHLANVADLIDSEGVPVRLRATSTDELAESTFVGPKVAGGWGHAVVIDGVRRTPAGPVFQVRDPWATWVTVNGRAHRSGEAALPKELTKVEFEATYSKWLDVIEVISPLQPARR